MTNKLPQGWVECELKDFAFVKGGKRLPAGANYSESETEFPYIRVTNFDNMSVNLDDIKYLTQEIQQKIKNYTISKEDVYISIAGSIGKAGTIPSVLDGANLTENAAKIVHKINKDYLSYILNSDEVQHQIALSTKSTTQPKLALYRIEALKIKLAPLYEQKRIVEKIEEEFEKIDEGVEKLKLAQEQIKQYRQSVLKAAFEGKLYKTTEWEDTTLEKVLGNGQYSMKRGPFGSSLKKTFFVPKGIRVFEQYNPINNDPYWARYYISEKKYEELKAFTACAGDLLISCSGTLGKILELPKDVEKGIINQALLKITLNSDKILNKFFIYLFRSPIMQKKIFDNTIGTAIQNIASVKELKKIKIILPNINEQKLIVAEIEKRFEVADEAEQIINDNLANAEQLKQSILKKAFEGRLVPQDPTDEPASVLLEKIKFERNK